MNLWMKVALVALLATGCAVESKQEMKVTRTAPGAKGAPIECSPAPSPGSGRVSLSFKDCDLREVLKSLGEQAGVSVAADPEIVEKVTIRVEKMSWRDAIDLIAREARLKIQEGNGGAIRLTRPPLISLQFHDADIKDVLLLIAQQGGANIVLSGDIQGKVTLQLEDVFWIDALETVAKSGGYLIVREGTPRAETVLRVASPQSQGAMLETRSWTLSRLRPRDPYNARISGIESFATGGSLDIK